MKKTIKISALALALVSLSNNAMAAEVANATADANVISALTLEKTSGGNELNFGTFAPDASNSGTITSAGSTTGGVSYISGATHADFTVGGDGARSYSVTLPTDNQITLSNGTAADDMIATLSVEGGASRSLSSGADTFQISGELAVAADQTAGTYSATYTVTANY